MSRYIGENVMEKYEKLEIEVIELDGMDVITTSCYEETSEVCAFVQDSGD